MYPNLLRQIEANRVKRARQEALTGATKIPSPLAVFARANINQTPTWGLKFVDPVETLPEPLRTALYPFDLRLPDIPQPKIEVGF